MTATTAPSHTAPSPTGPSHTGPQDLESMTIRELLAELAALEDQQPTPPDPADSARADAISQELRQRRLALRESTIDGAVGA